MTQLPQRRCLRDRIKKWLREQAKVEVVLPVVVAAGLLGYVLSIAVAPRSASQLWAVIQQTWLPILILTLPYLASRLWVWNRLLLQLGFTIPWRQLAASFAAGEMTKSIPAGVYTQNYLLGKLNHFSQVSTVRSSMATTAILGLEALVAVPIVLVVGVPGAPWLFWTVLGTVLAWLAVLVLAWALAQYGAHRLDPQHRPLLHRIAELAEEFLEAGAELIAWRTLVSVIPTVIYMLVYVVDMHLILRALGYGNISLFHTMVIYAAIVLAVVLVPIPTELGRTEITGLNALVAYGVPASTAAIAMLSLRLLATGTTVLGAGALLFLLRDELRVAAEEEGPRGAVSGEASV
jgi:uncharacterized membrane protein YbhN (UPF0104 family)